MNFKMFNKFKALLMAGAMLVSVVACSDYDDDIADLSDRLEELEGTTVTIDDLATQLAAIELTIPDVTELTTDVEALLADVEDLLADVEGLDGDLSDFTASITEDLAELKASLESYVDGEITELSETVAAIYATIESLNAVSARVAALEAFCEGLGETTIAAELDALQDQFDALNGTIASWTGEDMLAYISANGYLTKNEIVELGYITAADFATLALAAGYIDATQAQALIDAGNYTTLDAVKALGYLTSDDIKDLLDEEALEDYLEENLSTYLGNYVTSSAMNTAIADFITESAIEDFITESALEGLLDVADLQAYLTKYNYTTSADVTAAIEGYFSEEGEVDLSDYATGEELKALEASLKTALESYATTEALTALETKIEGYATTTAMQDYVASQLEDYATTDWVKLYLADALTSYYTSEEIDKTLTSYTTKEYLYTFIEKYDAIIVGIYSDIDDVAEALSTFKTTVAVKFLETEATIDAVEVEVSDLSTKLSSLETYIKTMANQIYVLEQEVAGLLIDVENLQGDLSDLDDKLATYLETTVQSMVYVPSSVIEAYYVSFGEIYFMKWSADRVTYLPAADGAIPSTTLKFRVNPTSVAAELAQLWENAKATDAEFSFNEILNVVDEEMAYYPETTRAVEESAFTIVDFTYEENTTGLFSIDVILDDETYAALGENETYGIALSIKTYSEGDYTDYLSDFIPIGCEAEYITASDLQYATSSQLANAYREKEFMLESFELKYTEDGTTVPFWGVGVEDSGYDLYYAVRGRAIPFSKMVNWDDVLDLHILATEMESDDDADADADLTLAVSHFDLTDKVLADETSIFDAADYYTLSTFYMSLDVEDVETIEDMIHSTLFRFVLTEEGEDVPDFSVDADFDPSVDARPEYVPSAVLGMGQTVVEILTDGIEFTLEDIGYSETTDPKGTDNADGESSIEDRVLTWNYAIETSDADYTRVVEILGGVDVDGNAADMTVAQFNKLFTTSDDYVTAEFILYNEDEEVVPGFGGLVVADNEAASATNIYFTQQSPVELGGDPKSVTVNFIELPATGKYELVVIFTMADKTIVTVTIPQIKVDNIGDYAPLAYTGAQYVEFDWADVEIQESALRLTYLTGYDATDLLWSKVVKDGCDKYFGTQDVFEEYMNLTYSNSNTVVDGAWLSTTGSDVVRIRFKTTGTDADFIECDGTVLQYYYYDVDGNLLATIQSTVYLTGYTSIEDMMTYNDLYINTDDADYPYGTGITTLAAGSYNIVTYDLGNALKSDLILAAGCEIVYSIDDVQFGDFTGTKPSISVSNSEYQLSWGTWNDWDVEVTATLQTSTGIVLCTKTFFVVIKDPVSTVWQANSLATSFDSDAGKQEYNIPNAGKAAIANALRLELSAYGLAVTTETATGTGVAGYYAWNGYNNGSGASNPGSFYSTALAVVGNDEIFSDVRMATEYEDYDELLSHVTINKTTGVITYDGLALALAKTVKFAVDIVYADRFHYAEVTELNAETGEYEVVRADNRIKTTFTLTLNAAN